MIISRAPLRISFFGGGTDFPEYFAKEIGAVLATAIDKYSYVTASTFHSHLFDYAVRVSYSKGELAKTIDDIQHPVFRECLRFCNLDKDVELHTVADLPAFTGLGSSSTFTVSLLQVLHAYKGEYVPPLKLAYEAIHIERRILGGSVSESRIKLPPPWAGSMYWNSGQRTTSVPRLYPSPSSGSRRSSRIYSLSLRVLSGGRIKWRRKKFRESI